MSLVIALVVQLLHLLLMLAMAPVALGVSRRIEARLADRAGAPVMQPWRDLIRLARKQAAFAGSASGVFELAPSFAFAATLVAALLVPSFARGMAAAPLADIVPIAGLLLLARAVMVLAAIESGTALGGLGGSRAMALSVATEPALLLAVFSLALLTGTTNLDAMERVLRGGAVGARLPLLLALAALSVIAVARLRGAPMAESAMAHEYSGRALALLLWGAALRQLLWLGLLGNLLLPWGLADATGTPLSWLVGLVAWGAKVGALTLALALWQGARAVRPAEVFLVAILLALLAAAFLFASQGTA